MPPVVDCVEVKELDFSLVFYSQALTLRRNITLFPKYSKVPCPLLYLIHTYFIYILSTLLSSLRVPSVLCVVQLYSCACSQASNLCSKLGCVDVVSRLEFALEGVLSHAAWW